MSLLQRSQEIICARSARHELALPKSTRRLIGKGETARAAHGKAIGLPEGASAQSEATSAERKLLRSLAFGYPGALLPSKEKKQRPRRSREAAENAEVDARQTAAAAASRAAIKPAIAPALEIKLLTAACNREAILARQRGAEESPGRRSSSFESYSKNQESFC